MTSWILTDADGPPALGDFLQRIAAPADLLDDWLGFVIGVHGAVAAVILGLRPVPRGVGASLHLGGFADQRVAVCRSTLRRGIAVADALRLALEPRGGRKLGDRRAGFVEAFRRRELRRHLRGADRGGVGRLLVGGALGLGALRRNVLGLDLLGDGLAAFRAPGGAAGAPWPAAAPLVLPLLLALGARVLGEERLPVGDRNLIVVGMDFAEGEEAVSVPAIFDERRLKRRFARVTLAR